MRHLTQSPPGGPEAPVGASETPAEPLRKTYRVQELADELDVSKYTLYRAIEVGDLEAYRAGRGRGTLRIPVEAIPAYKALMKSAAATKAAHALTPAPATA